MTTAQTIYVYRINALRGHAGPMFLEAGAIASSIEAAERIIGVYCEVRSLDWNYVGEPVPGSWMYRGTNGCEFHVTRTELDAALES